MRFTNKRCSTRGSAIAEGVVGLMLVIWGAVAGTLLLLNSGAGIFFKEKLLIVTNMTAQYAAQNANDPNLQADTYTYVERVLPQFGLTPDNVTITITNPVTIKTNTGPIIGVQVRVSNRFPVFGNGTVLPMCIQLSDTEFAALGSGLPAPIGWRLMESEPGTTPGFEPIVSGNVRNDIASYQSANPSATITATPVYAPANLSPSQLNLPDM
jgi:hypothetical protein